jgi:hypothetical protein
MQASTAHTPPAACDQPPNREERDEQHGESISGHQLSPACRVTVRRILGGFHHEYALETVTA